MACLPGLGCSFYATTIRRQDSPGRQLFGPVGDADAEAAEIIKELELVVGRPEVEVTVAVLPPLAAVPARRRIAHEAESRRAGHLRSDRAPKLCLKDVGRQMPWRWRLPGQILLHKRLPRR